ncbi:MAG TPA: DNA-3-methyladenine glycosylase [Terracidiphilus sp.]|jgi:DNA-3-methyladenine glycosylase
MKNDTERLPGKLLPRSLFLDSPEHVAPRLLGKLLVSRTSAGLMAGRIVEVEAYLGPHNATPDPAAHSHRGPTPRNEVLFGPAGHAYVYFIYGRYYCMNFSCEDEGHGGGVLLRAVEPVAGTKEMARRRGLPADARPCDLTGGPGRLCEAMGITRKEHNGLDLVDPGSPLQVRDDGMSLKRIRVTPRVGIRHAVDLPLRFAVPDSGCVSGPKTLTGKWLFLREGSVRKLVP